MGDAPRRFGDDADALHWLREHSPAETIPFELPAYDERSSNGWIKRLLQGEAVLRGHMYALSQPNSIDVLRQLRHDALLVGRHIQQFDQEVEKHGALHFGRDERVPLIDQWRQSRVEYSEEQWIIKNPSTARNRALGAWKEAMGLLFQIRARKHEPVKVQNVGPETRRRVDALLSTVPEENYLQFFDPPAVWNGGNLTTTKWGK